MVKKKKKAKKKMERRIVGAIGRSRSGQFTKGNTLSRGNKSHTNNKANKLKKTILEAVTAADMKAIIRKLVKMAKGGDIAATKELFDRCLGRSLQVHEVDVELKTYTPEQCDSIRKLLAGRCVNADS